MSQELRFWYCFSNVTKSLEFGALIFPCQLDSFFWRNSTWRKDTWKSVPDGNLVIWVTKSGEMEYFQWHEERIHEPKMVKDRVSSDPFSLSKERCVEILYMAESDFRDGSVCGKFKEGLLASAGIQYKKEPRIHGREFQIEIADHIKGYREYLESDITW